VQPPYRQPYVDPQRGAQERELDEMLAATRKNAARRRLWTQIAFALFATCAVGTCAYPFARAAYEDHAQKARLKAEELAKRLDPSMKSRAQETIAEARAALRTRSAAFAAATTKEALDAIAPGRAPCPVRLSAPRMGAGDSYTTYGSIDGNYFGGWSVHRIDHDPFDPSARDLARLDEFAAALDKGTGTKDQLRAAADAQRGTSRDVLFRTLAEHAPIAAGGGPTSDYVGGMIIGRAYVYDEGLAKVVCAGSVVAQNSSSLKIEYTRYGVLDTTSEYSALRGALERDLDVQLRTAIAERLRAAVPAGSPEAARAADEETADDDETTDKPPN
jgi:hypothetical protein